MATRHVEIAVAGIIAATAKLNVRQNGPSRFSPVLRKQEAGAQLEVAAITAGDNVEGNSLWYRLADNSFVWSGACGPLQTTQSVSTAPVVALPAQVQFPTANVIDLYHYDAVSSFAEAKVAGVLGVIHKSSTGQSGRDDQYEHRREHAMEAGMLWGAYHWGTAAPAAAQVENFLNAANPDEQTLIALDFEQTPGNQMTLANAREFLELIEQKLGRKAVIYSGSTLKNALGSTRDPFFGSHRLWLAQYGPLPQVQASWDSYWLWQFTEGKTSDPRRRRIAGIPGNSAGEVDCNYYPLSTDQLVAEWAS
jgi:GH25 family lysozyme M1 (1,4-beta-N-acetylmuramidase)